MAQNETELPLEPENYEEQCETLETEEIHEIGERKNLNVIPLQFINLDRGLGETTIVQIRSPKSLERDRFEGGSHRGKYYKQTYRSAWENMTDFKGWLKGVKGQPTRAYCTYCRKTLHAHRLSLLKHTCTIRHQKAAQLHASENELNYGINPVALEGMVTSENEDDNDAEPNPNAYISQEELEGGEEHALDQEEIDSEECEDESERQPKEGDAPESGVPSQISTTVTDTSRGGSVSGLAVSLYKLVEGRWTFIDERLTDAMGRCSDFFNNRKFTPGRYKLHLDVDRYFESKKVESVFPFIEIIFDAGSSSKYHFPVLLGPNTYTTYRAFSE